MAVVVGSALGNMRGKLGNMYARIRRGKTIWSVMPTTSGKSTEEQIEIQRRFNVSVLFSKYLLKDYDLKSIWSKNLKGFSTPYHRCVSKNYRYVSPTTPTTDNVVSPDGFMIDFNSGNLSSTAFTASVPAVNSFTYIDDSEVDLSFVGSLVFYGTSDEKLAPFTVTPFRKHVSGYNFATTYSLSVPLDSVQQKMASLYESMILYLTLATKNAEGNIVQNSKSLSFIGN